VSAAVATWLAAYATASDPLIVACSGGTDSLALAVSAHGVGAAHGRRLLGATVDHQLQPGSADRASATAAQLADIGYRQVEVLTVDVVGQGGPEAAARRARYDALRQVAERAGAPGRPAAVLLAHTADDQAETVLLGLARGSGPRSIAGMRAWRAPWGRPLLAVRRADTEQTCRRAGLTPWQDPHNADPQFTRVRLRREVLPLLDEVLGGGVRPALARTAELMAQDLDALDEIAATALDQACRPDGSLDIAALRRHPGAIVGRVLRSWAGAGGSGPLTFDHLRRMTAQVEGDAGPRQVRIPGLLDVVSTGGALRLQPR
jgi:tRNA(Ile)-lysidine synthase